MWTLAPLIVRPPSPLLEPYLKPALPRPFRNRCAAEEFHFGFDGAEEFGVACAEDGGEFGDACGGADGGEAAAGDCEREAGGADVAPDHVGIDELVAALLRESGALCFGEAGQLRAAEWPDLAAELGAGCLDDHLAGDAERLVSAAESDEVAVEQDGGPNLRAAVALLGIGRFGPAEVGLAAVDGGLDPEAQAERVEQSDFAEQDRQRGAVVGAEVAGEHARAAAGRWCP